MNKLTVLIMALALGGCGQRYGFSDGQSSASVASGQVRVTTELLDATNIFGIRVKIENLGASPIDLKVGKIEMVDGAEVSNAMEPDVAAQFIRDRNAGKMFAMGGFMGQAAMQDVSAQARSQMLESGSIPPGNTRSGLVYFRRVPAAASLKFSPAITAGGIALDLRPMSLSAR